MILLSTRWSLILIRGEAAAPPPVRRRAALVVGARRGQPRYSAALGALLLQRLQLRPVALATAAGNTRVGGAGQKVEEAWEHSLVPDELPPFLDVTDRLAQQPNNVLPIT